LEQTLSNEKLVIGSRFESLSIQKALFITSNETRNPIGLANISVVLRPFAKPYANHVIHIAKLRASIPLSTFEF